MADQFESGFFGDATPAWHKKGIVIPGFATTDEALKLGGIDWPVEKRQAYTTKMGPTGPEFIEMPDRFAIVRTTDDAVLGDVGAGYQPIQNRQAFDFVDVLIGEKQAKWETAISIKGGKTVAGLLSLTQSAVEIRKGDKHYRFLTAITSHDGSGAMRVFPTDVRVVCANTVDAALGSRDAALTINISHRGNVDAKAADAARVLARADEYFIGFDEFMQALASKKVTKGQLAEWVEAVMPAPKAGDTAGLKAAQTAHAAKVQLLLDCVRTEKLLLPQFTKSGGQSAYELFNGFTRYIDHVAGGKQADRFEYAMVGTGNAAKNQAVKALAQIVDVKLPK